MPFAVAAAMLGYFRRVTVHEEGARRVTEQAGAAYVAVQEAAVEEIERTLPAAPEGPAVQQLSVDGAMVPLRGKGEWAEVKTLAIGTVQPPVLNRDGEPEVHTTAVSYFSRLADQATFTRLALVETQRRGVETAGTVCGVVDGAEWEQTFLDVHRADAVRILDWAHAAGYVASTGQAVFGAGTGEAAQWIATQIHELRHGEPEVVLGKLRGLQEDLALQGGEALETMQTSLAYLEKRQDQIHYAEFVAQGYPIGSGMVESGNKLVVEARLKGAGMHWARENVNPMVGLRTVACSDRWDEAWEQISERLRQEARERAVARRRARQASEATVTTATEVATAAVEPDRVMRTTTNSVEGEAVRTPDESMVSRSARRPAANHPWRHLPIGRVHRAS